MRRLLAPLAVGILLVAFNLRASLASVGPFLAEIQVDLALGTLGASMLTTLPVLCFGVLAPFAPRLGRRFGIEPVLSMVLVVLAAALLLRVAGGVAVLITGTALAAGAVAVANVLVPALVKREYAAHAGALMGVYTATLSGSAALAAGLTVPIARGLDGGWRVGLGLWAVPAVVAALLWLPLSRRHSLPPNVNSTAARSASVLRSPLAWQVTLFMGLQSLGFYAVLAWLPTIYRDEGWSPPAAGALLSVSILAQLPASLLLPTIAVRARTQFLPVALTSASAAAGLLGVLFLPDQGAWAWAILLGVGQGGAFALALTLFVLRAGSSADTARLSAMAQTFGYVIAAAGPLLIGLLRDSTGGWDVPLAMLLVLVLVQLGAGLLAARPLTLGRQERHVPSPR